MKRACDRLMVSMHPRCIRGSQKFCRNTEDNEWISDIGHYVAFTVGGICVFFYLTGTMTLFLHIEIRMI